MGRLRKRSYWIKPTRKKYDSLQIVYQDLLKALPNFRKSRISREKTMKGVTIRGRWPMKGRHVYDWEVVFEKERNEDVEVKVNLWGKKGTRRGETYRVSMARSPKVAPKIAKWVFQNVVEIKKLER